MRKITEAASNAFKANRPFSSGNTSVLIEDDYTRMYLHGNLIAERLNLTNWDQRVMVTLAGWGTPTTRERVNGLLTTLGRQEGFYQEDFAQWFSTAIGDICVDPDERLTLDMETGWVDRNG